MDLITLKAPVTRTKKKAPLPASVVLEQEPLTEAQKELVWSAMCGCDFNPVFTWANSDDSRSLNSHETRIVKGVIFQKIVTECLKVGSVQTWDVSEKGYDLTCTIPGILSRDVNVEVKFEHTGKPKTLVERKLSNTIGVQENPTYLIRFDILMIISDYEISLFFGDEIADKVFRVNDGFKFVSETGKGEIISMNKNPGVHYAVEGPNSWALLNQLMCERAENIVNGTCVFTPLVSGPLRREKSRRKRIRNR
jgi:hypothetical protein